jgi:uncharacterized protein YjbI with pentapeptide repeats
MGRRKTVNNNNFLRGKMSEEGKKVEDKKERRFDPELLKKGLRCDLDQYDMLKRCSEKKDITEWNKWREKNHKEDVLLEGANLSGWNLKGVSLSQVWVALITPEKFTSFISGDVYLCGAKIKDADLEEADFRSAHLENTKLNRAHLERAKFLDAHLEGTIFYRAHLEGADVETAITNGATSFWKIKADRKTNFLGVGLDNVRIDPATEQLLKYNIRRMNWEDWYKQHKILKWPMRLFWLMSDYGLSTGRIIITFLVLMIAFACVYYVWGMIAPPGIVDYLFVDGNGVKVTWWLVPVRAIHFSVVIMTVGFTNMHANAHSFWAHILVSLQMILGFVLLGALVTRFAVLFTAGGPAGRFAKEKKEEK